MPGGHENVGIWILVAAVLIVLIYYYLSRRKQGGRKSGSLRTELRQLLNLPPAEAEKTIERHLKSLQERFPGRSEEWYLEKIIYDLERDR